MNISFQEDKKIMVFFSTCACVEYFGIVLGRLLKGLVDVTAIHGKKAKRDKVFDSFRKKSESGKRILNSEVCTDVPAYSDTLRTKLKFHCERVARAGFLTDMIDLGLAQSVIISGVSL